MARFIDLDDDEDAAVGDSPMPGDQQQQQQQQLLRTLQDISLKNPNGIARAGVERWINDLHKHQSENQRMNDMPSAVAPSMTFRSPVTEALQCYPIVVAIASSIDQNTLDSLARTSRQIHDGLIQYRSILLASTLRCCNERVPVDPAETFRYRARAGNWFYMEDGRSYNGKSGDCARDLVGECRRCSEVICRNCAIKPPAPVTLRERHRRLCKPCTRAPIATLAKPPLDAELHLFSEAVQRAVCQCDAEGVWLCQPCGRSIRAADHEYQRIWRWRNQYGEVLGGLGTGIGEGDRGVICGRESDCCAAKERAHQIDCDAEDARDITGDNTGPWTPDMLDSGNVNPADALFNSDLQPSQERNSPPRLGSGYHRHEVEGIGGVVKRTRVRMVRIGACVPEWDDERAGGGGRVLGREVRGSVRSWCGWCWRVIPGAKDRGEGGFSSSSSDGGSGSGSRRTSSSAGSN